MDNLKVAVGSLTSKDRKALIKLDKALIGKQEGSERFSLSTVTHNELDHGVLRYFDRLILLESDIDKINVICSPVTEAAK